MTRPAHTPAMGDELKPCPNPWCRSHKGGKQPKVSTLKSLYLSHVRCEGCNLEGPWEDTEAEAITAWNTRTETQSQATIDELVAGLRKAEAGLTCRGDDAHYCPNCDNTTFSVREDVRTILSRHEGGQS